MLCCVHAHLTQLHTPKTLSSGGGDGGAHAQHEVIPGHPTGALAKRAGDVQEGYQEGDNGGSVCARALHPIAHLRARSHACRRYDWQALPNQIHTRRILSRGKLQGKAQ